jgi:Fe-S-cluster containining protein
MSPGIKASKVPCIRCGICCSKYQPFLGLEEAHLIASRLGSGWEHFLAAYSDPRWPGDQIVLVRHIKGACPFLQTYPEKKQRLCLIHSYKPKCCREWESRLDRADCREGLKTIWDLTVDSAGQVSGTREKIESFACYLESLSTGSTGVPACESNY